MCTGEGNSNKGEEDYQEGLHGWLKKKKRQTSLKTETNKINDFILSCSRRDSFPIKKNIKKWRKVKIIISPYGKIFYVRFFFQFSHFLLFYYYLLLDGHETEARTGGEDPGQKDGIKHCWLLIKKDDSFTIIIKEWRLVSLLSLHSFLLLPNVQVSNQTINNDHFSSFSIIFVINNYYKRCSWCQLWVRPIWCRRRGTTFELHHQCLCRFLHRTNVFFFVFFSLFHTFPHLIIVHNNSNNLLMQFRICLHPFEWGNQFKPQLCSSCWRLLSFLFKHQLCHSRLWGPPSQVCLSFFINNHSKLLIIINRFAADGVYTFSAYVMSEDGEDVLFNSAFFEVEQEQSMHYYKHY